MALDPDILLVDEPSAGLDPITADEIDELLVDLKKKGTTLVVVTHNIPSARHVGDELAMLHEGQSHRARHRRRSWIAATTSWCERSCGPKGRGSHDGVIEGRRRRRVRGHRRAAVHRGALHDRRAADAVRGPLRPCTPSSPSWASSRRARSCGWPGWTPARSPRSRIPPSPAGKFRVKMEVRDDLHHARPHRLGRHDADRRARRRASSSTSPPAPTQAPDRARGRHDSRPRAVLDGRSAAAGERDDHAWST